mgnify:CR=1 FL=1
MLVTKNMSAIETDGDDRLLNFPGVLTHMRCSCTVDPTCNTSFHTEVNTEDERAFPNLCVQVEDKRRQEKTKKIKKIKKIADQFPLQVWMVLLGT